MPGITRQRGGPLRRGPGSGGPRLPQHLADDGSWCPGSGDPPKPGGECTGCAARRSSLRPGGKRTDPDAVAEAAVAYAVKLLLGRGLPLPSCAVPLRPEPDAAAVEDDDPFITIVVLGYPDGTEHRIWITVEGEDRRDRRHGREHEHG